MSTDELAKSYLQKCEIRLEVLELLLKRSSYSDVIREAQECVELCLKGMLRLVGVDPPKIHDVSNILKLHRDKLDCDVDQASF